jgi:hypothetical protein
MREKRRNGRVTTKTSVEDEIVHLRGLDLIPILHQSELMMYGKDVMERTSPGLRSM